MRSGNSFRERLKEGGKGRYISFSGLVLLTISFFLPQVEGCSSDIVPVQETFSSNGLEWIVGTGLPFLFAMVGLLFYLFRIAIRSKRGRRIVTRLFSFVLFLFLLWSALRLTIVVVIGVEENRPIAASYVVVLVVATTVSAAAVGSGARPPLAIMLCGLASMGYFSTFLSIARYGLVVSIVACALITVGGLLEVLAAVRTPRAPPDG